MLLSRHTITPFKNSFPRLLTANTLLNNYKFCPTYNYSSHLSSYSRAKMTTKAIVFVEKGKAEIQEVSIPKLRDDYVLVKVNAIGVNPTDWKHIDSARAAPGSRVGCDFAGIVEEVGPKVTKAYSKGDRIAGVVHGSNFSNTEDGIGGYLVAKGDVQVKTPANITDEEAATLGISISTVGQGLYKTLDLPLPGTVAPNSQGYILIYGGATATGIYGIQFAKLSGFKVLATASPHNFEYLQSLGAEKVFDYKAAGVGEEIRAYTQNSLKFVWDCTGFGGAICAAALSSEGGKYSTIMPVDKSVVDAINPKVDGPHATLMYSIFNEEFTKGGNTTPAKPDEFEFAKKIWAITEGLLAEGKLVAPKISLNRTGTGFEGMMGGLDELRNNKVSAEKLVYTLN